VTADDLMGHYIGLRRPDLADVTRAVIKEVEAFAAAKAGQSSD
jgi:hypothetical protein